MFRRILSGRDWIVTRWKEIRPAPYPYKSVIIPDPVHELYLLVD